MIRNWQSRSPQVDDTAYVDPSAQVIGDVRIGARASIWPCAVLRGDSASIEIGVETSVQDGTVIHVDEWYSARIGARVLVGHRAVLHGCTVADDCVIGIGAIVLNGATVGRGCIIAAGALVPENSSIEPDSLVMGMPGKVRRKVAPEEHQIFRDGVALYVERARIMKAQG